MDAGLNYRWPIRSAARKCIIRGIPEPATFKSMPATASAGGLIFGTAADFSSGLSAPNKQTLPISKGGNFSDPRDVNSGPAPMWATIGCEPGLGVGLHEHSRNISDRSHCRRRDDDRHGVGRRPDRSWLHDCRLVRDLLHSARMA